ncbi:CaiB/BaiF CoA transferase family protein [Actinomycetospora termitidis]|uniref:CoA transferase n=1 Tax=Actinomycetospora termitidis TaxID=3053470 RepID=A0ABT7M612_9PSEU|nr:CoA transferase [Actinomycetospora sp. Odt1-22]MDL5156099.1 CoA transferase [Actinomycetospora sp. Odt1-22]
MTTLPAPGPLDGIRVLDLSRVVMGPLATQILADQGADVILVEADGGDTNRVMGPGPHSEFSGISLNLLRNKRSLDVDLKSHEGHAAVRALIETCDVVVATMRPQVLVRLGLDYPSVRAIRPDVVYCQAQGFPLESDRAGEPAYDDIIQAATGVSDLLERVTGTPGLMPTIFADKVCGLVMAQAVTAALLHRERTGAGQHVEVPMVQAMTAFMLAEHGSGAIAEPPVREAGYPRILTPERRPHRTLDGLVHMLPYRPEHYSRLFATAGVADAGSDPRYVDLRATIANADSLYRDVRAVCATRTTQEWLDFCREAGIPATRVTTLQEMVDELPIAEHPVTGWYRVLPQMANFEATPGGVRRAAPLIGEHTHELLREVAPALHQEESA